MSDTPPLKKLSRPRIVAMVWIDVIAAIVGLALFVWLQPKDLNAAFLALVSCVVIAGFFNLVIVLVSLKP